MLAKEGSLLGEVSSGSSPKEGSVLTEVSSGDYYKTVAIQAMACYAYDGEMRGSSDTAEERSYMENEDIKQCFNVKHMVDYAWRPVTDSKLLSFLGGVAHKREVGSLLRMVMLSSLIGPRPSEVVNQLTNPRIIPGESLLFSEKEHGGSWKKQGT